MCANHMIGASSTKKIVSVTTPATKRKPPPKLRRSAGRVSTSITVAIFGANHMTRTRHEHGEAGIGTDEGVAGSCERDRDRAEHQQSDPSRRAEEHQQGERELVAADPFEARHHQEVPVLHVALAPAQIPADELDQRRRVLLEARAFLRHHAHLVAGAPHQHRFDLIVAEDVAVDERALAENRQVAVHHERRDPDDGVVTPVGPAVALPPGAADGVGAHAETHAELEDARKGAGRRHADDQALQDAELRIGLHDAHETQHGIGGHQAVGVQRQGEVMLLAPAVAEVADVAGLEAGIHFAAAIGERNAAAPGVRQLREMPALDGGMRKVAGVAQHIDVELLRDAARSSARRSSARCAG